MAFSGSMHQESGKIHLCLHKTHVCVCVCVVYVYMNIGINILILKKNQSSNAKSLKETVRDQEVETTSLVIDRKSVV